MPAGPVKRSRSLTVEKAVLKAAEKDRLQALYVTGLILGLRPGELLALSWSNLDLEKGTLKVTQPLKREHDRLSLGETTTASSRRTLTMPTKVVSALRAHKTAQAAERLKAAAWTDEDLVFCNAIGG